MSADIPTPFNLGRTASGSDALFDANDETAGGVLDVAGTDATGDVKVAGGLPSDEDGVNVNTNSSGSGHAGTRYYFNGTPSALDFTASGEKRLIAFAMQCNAVNRRQIDTLANDGGVTLLYSGADTTSEVRQYRWGGNDVFFMSRTGMWLIIIDPNKAGSIADVGTFDPADCLRYYQGHTHAALIGSNTAWHFWSAYVLISTEKDSADLPRIHGTSDWTDLVDAVQGTTGYTGQNHIYVEQSGSIVNLFCPVAIGDASQPSPVETDFDDLGVAVISPSDDDPADPRFHLTTDAMRFYLDLRENSADTAVFSGTYIWGTAAPFDFNQITAIVTFNSPTFNGMGDFTLGTSITGPATFTLASGSDVIIEGANLNGSTINGDCLLNTDTDLTDITINGDLRINIAADTTLDFSNVTVTGSVFNDAGSNTLTINASNGSSLTADDPGTGNGQIDIQNSVDITITVLDASDDSPIEFAHVLLYLTSDFSTEVINSATNASGVATAAFNFSSDADVEGWARNVDFVDDDYRPENISGTITSSGFAITVRLTPTS